MDYEQEFLSHLLPYGIVLKGIAINSKSPVRYGKTKSGWAYLSQNEIGAVGSWGDWKTGESHKWFSCGQNKPLTAAEKAHWAAKKREQERQQAEDARIRHQEARRTAKSLMVASTYQTGHSYAVRKELGGVRVKASSDGKLLIPIYNANGELVNVQSIAKDGEKRFLYGGEIKGCSLLIGSIAPFMVLTEGWATGMSIHLATGYSVVVAFNAGNLLPVCEQLRGDQRIIRVIVGADNDKSSTGARKALACQVMDSDFVRLAMCPLAGADFNDLHVREGLGAVKTVIDQVDLTGFVARGGYLPSDSAWIEDETADGWAEYG